MADFFAFGSGGLQETARQIFAKLKTLLDGKAPEEDGVHYGKCITAAATQAKVVTVNGTVTLTEGTKILVWFQYAQTYNGAPTLNVNELGAKNIGRVSGTNAARYEWVANEVLLLVYDGTRWVITDGGIATTSYYGATKLATSATSTSTSLALTPASLNNAIAGLISDAPVYSASATYAVGDRVRYNYNVWACVTAIETAEAWTAAHWEALPPVWDKLDDLDQKVGDVKLNGASIVDANHVANLPVIADFNQTGAVTLGASVNNGLTVNNGALAIAPATVAHIKAGDDTTKRPLTPGYQHRATFYGLAKAAGDTTQQNSANAPGEYTESAKSAISTMLNGAVSVSGTTPTITAQPGVRYVCGEVTTLDITLPASGIVDVTFESGSTPTVLTVPSSVRWANGFDPTSLDADTSYELNIMDGLGVAAQWT